MLTHSINIYQPPPTTFTPPAVQQRPASWPHSPVPKMGKFEYNKYLNDLPFRREDFIIHASIDNYDKISHSAIYKVVDIQEIHYMVEYANDGKPNCIQVTNLAGTTKFWVNPDRFKRCPQEVIERFGLHNGTFDANAHYK